MSFGLDIRVDRADGYVTTIEVVDGQTYNLTPMWRRGFGSSDPEWKTRDLGGMSCHELRSLTLWAVGDYIAHTEEYIALDPPNGWGDHEGYFTTLLKFARLVHEHPTGVIEWNG